MDHIVPRTHGGTTTLDNLALSCQGCNNHKYISIASIDPLTRWPAPIYNPRRENWAEHFCWSNDYLRIIGLTPTGRATVEVVQLNRETILNLRRVLLLAGVHPPGGEDS